MEDLESSLSARRAMGASHELLVEMEPFVMGCESGGGPKGSPEVEAGFKEEFIVCEPARGLMVGTTTRFALVFFGVLSFSKATSPELI